MIELGFAEAVRTERGHQRRILPPDFLQIPLEVSLEPLVRIHDLDRECVLALDGTPDTMSIRCHQQYRSKAWLHGQCRIAYGLDDGVARVPAGDPGEVRPQPTALASRLVAARAVRRKDLSPRLGIAGVFVPGWDCAEALEKRDQRPQFVVGHRAGGHHAARDAGPYGLEDAVISRTVDPEPREV